MTKAQWLRWQWDILERRLDEAEREGRYDEAEELISEMDRHMDAELRWSIRNAENEALGRHSRSKG